MVAIAEVTSGVGPALFGKARKRSGHGIRKTVVGTMNSTAGAVHGANHDHSDPMPTSTCSMQGAAKSPALLGKAKKTTGHGMRKIVMVGAAKSGSLGGTVVPPRLPLFVAPTITIFLMPCPVVFLQRPEQDGVTQEFVVMLRPSHQILMFRLELCAQSTVNLESWNIV